MAVFFSEAWMLARHFCWRVSCPALSFENPEAIHGLFDGKWAAVVAAEPCIATDTKLGCLFMAWMCFLPDLGHVAIVIVASNDKP